MLEQILFITVPVFAIVLLGFLYGRFDQHNLDVTNKINMNLFVPALLLFILTEKIESIVYMADLFAAALIVVIGSGLIAWAICRLINTPVLALVPSTMFNNSGNLGLPLSVLAFGIDSLSLSVVVFVVSAGCHFSIGIWMMTGRFDPVALFLNPVFSAAMIGISCNILGWHVPAILLPGLEMLAGVAVPLMLVTLGIKLAANRLSHLELGIKAAILVPVVGLVTALPAIQLLQLNDDKARLLLLFAILPPAIMNFLMAERYHRQADQVASIVMIGNLSAVLTVPALFSVIL